jgi:hypothetical protein
MGKTKLKKNPSKKTQNCTILSLFRPVKILGLRGNERISGQLKFLRWPLDRSGRSKKWLYMVSGRVWQE